jgi:hypothetical protein
MPVRTFITAIALFMCSTVATAQTLSPAAPASNRVKKEPGSYNQVVYISGLGPGCGISLNYDIRFNGTYKGLGARIGFGYVPKYTEEYREAGTPDLNKNVYKAKTSLPVGLTYVLAPSRKNMIEFGLGVTYLSGDSVWYDEVTTTYAWLGWISGHYRRTIGKHLLMRAGLSVIGTKSYIAPLPIPEWGIGYRF